MDCLDQIVFSGFTHQPAVELSEKLIEILPENQNKIFFSDNGSTTIEIAIKMSLQYHFNNKEKRDTIIAFENGFHGDTFGAMSVSGLDVYNGPFKDFSLNVLRLPLPNSNNIEEVKNLFKKYITEHNIASFVYEPLVQGAAGMQIYHAKYLNELLSIAKNNNIVCIADEVMTGFGKTGKKFASDHVEIKPDIMCLSKALTAGLLPMGITSCSDEIYNAFLSSEISKGFFHGHTYSANPLACSAAIAGIELLNSDEIQHGISYINSSNKTFLEELKHNAKVKNIRSIGVILAFELNIEMERYGNLRDKIFKAFLDKGVYLRPLGNTIYILTPYTISKKELQKVHETIKEVLSEF